MIKVPAILLTPPEAAERLKVSVSFLAKARMSGLGPRFVRMGRVVRYTEAALRDFMAAQTRISTSQV